MLKEENEGWEKGGGGKWLNRGRRKKKRVKVEWEGKMKLKDGGSREGVGGSREGVGEKKVNKDSKTEVKPVLSSNTLFLLGSCVCVPYPLCLNILAAYTRRSLGYDDMPTGWDLVSPNPFPYQIKLFLHAFTSMN